MGLKGHKCGKKSDLTARELKGRKKKKNVTVHHPTTAFQPKSENSIGWLFWKMELEGFCTEKLSINYIFLIYEVWRMLLPF